MGLPLAVLLVVIAAAEPPRLRTLHGTLACEECITACAEADSVAHLAMDSGLCWRLLGEPAVLGLGRDRAGHRAQVTGYEVGERELRVDAIVFPGDGAGGASTPLALALDDLDGEPRRLADYRGRIVIVNFWATWCGPCRAEMPVLAAIHRAYRDRGVEVIGAASDGAGSRDLVRRLATGAKVEYPIWLGANASDQRAFGFGSAIPATAILDREGRIAWREVGTVTEIELRRELDRLLQAENRGGR